MRPRDHLGRRTVLPVLLALVGVVALAPPASALPDQPDGTWRTDGIVFSVERVGNWVYLGGEFSALVSPDGSETLERRNLAALDLHSGAPIPHFDPAPNRRVYDIAASPDGATLYLGGRFTSVDGASRPRVAAIDAETGDVRPFRTSPNAPVRAVRLHGDALYIGGGFSAVAGATRPYVARVDATSGALHTFVASPNGVVRSLDVAHDGSRLFMAGEFTRVADLSGTHGLAGVDPSSGTVVWRPDARRPGLDVAATAEVVYASFGGAGGRARAYRASDATRMWSLGANGDVQTVAVRGSYVFFGGHFRPSDSEGPAFAGQDVNAMLAMVRASDGALMHDFAPQYCCYPGVWDIDTDASGISTGGAFTRVNDWVRRDGYAQFTDGGVVDESAPSAPEGLVVTGVTSSSVSLDWASSSDDVGVAGYRVVRDGSVVAEVTSTSYGDTGLAPETSYSYEVVAFDGAGNESEPAGPVSATTAAETTSSDPTALVAAGSSWRYLDSGSDPGSTWMQPAFDASAWAVGSAQLGFGDGDEVTTLASGHRVYYVRQQFQVSDVAGVSGLTVRLLRDDGAAVYVNGVEVVRDNLPDGTLTNDTNALDAQWGTAEQTFHEFVVSPSVLVEGTNVIAGSIHNKWYGDPDVSFDLALDAVRSS